MKPCRVLVVDDDPGIRTVLSYALDDEGYLIDEAANGEAALEAIRHQHPDVILLDMKMPGMDGWEFIRQYRERYGQQAAVIVVTAAQDAAERAAEVNAESFLAKPFDLDALIERVSEVRRRSKLLSG